MDKKIKSNTIIIALCITIILMTVGFIILSISYKNKIDKVNSYNVVFTNIRKSSSIKGGSKEPTSEVKILDNLNEIDMKVTLNSNNDELSYIATIENKGTIPIEILDVLESPNYKLKEFKDLINPITISMTDIKGKTILPDETIDLKIVFYYNPSNINTPKTFNYKIGLITRSSN